MVLICNAPSRKVGISWGKEISIGGGGIEGNRERHKPVDSCEKQVVNSEGAKQSRKWSQTKKKGAS